jgi:disulfide bond formation protein DsbB
MAYERPVGSTVVSQLIPRVLLALGTTVALVATAGSLYLSLGLGLIPCELCWYQRILMYPLVVVLGTALVEGRETVYRTTVPLAAGGAAIAAYHSYIQIYPNASSCTVGCSTVQYSVFGLTIPNLSLLAFALILLAMIGLRRPFVGRGR